MSANPSTDPTDVSSDVNAGGRTPADQANSASASSDSTSSAINGHQSARRRVSPADLAAAAPSAITPATNTTRARTEGDDTADTGNRRRGRRRRGRRNPQPESSIDKRSRKRIGTLHNPPPTSTRDDARPAAERRPAPKPGPTPGGKVANVPRAEAPASHTDPPVRAEHPRPADAAPHRPPRPKPGPPKPMTPKPATPHLAGEQSGSAHPNGAESPSNDSTHRGKHGPRKKEPRPVRGPVSAAPKPSDLVTVTAKLTKTGLAHVAATDAHAPTARGKNRRRKSGARPADGRTNPERLHTVRETSAGGLVISDLDLPVDELSAALIGRVDRRGRTMWSLPKGHIETGETAEQTAIREVAEETGIQGTVVAPLGKIDYWFVSEGRRIHKTVHHYLLRSVGGELSDEDYEVSEVAWVPLRDLPRKLTYSDERRLARMARGVIADLAADPNRLAQSEAESIRTEPNAYERAAAARNQRRNEPPPVRSRRRRRRPRRPAADDA